jgi:hypothetical protein
MGMVAMGSSGNPQTGWAAIRPVILGFTVAADAFVVIALLAGRPSGWLAPFIAFGVVLVGLGWLFVWSLRHRHDDD